MYVDNFSDGHVIVEYIPAHTEHTLYHKEELHNLPLPASSKEEAAMKLSLGANPSRILSGISTFYMLATQYYAEHCKISRANIGIYVLQLVYYIFMFIRCSSKSWRQK